VIDAFSGRTLFGKDPERRMYPASTTKILTALLIVESGKLDDEIVIKPEDTKVEPTIIGFKAGERHSRRRLLHALMLKSANDAALALARDNAGSVAAFAERMNLRASELGARSSHFVNPNGLHDSRHYTTALDLARISRAALQYPTLRKLVTTTSFDWVKPGGGVYHLVNRNRLLKGYPGCTGLKTGFTRAAGQTLCSSALRGNDEVVAVVLNTTNEGIWKDSMTLLDLGFAKLSGSR
jgi:D-alanyl-D-alanine carboxypeptidase (penicillin-binding protein 5/6)